MIEDIVAWIIAVILALATFAFVLLGLHWAIGAGDFTVLLRLTLWAGVGFGTFLFIKSKC